MTDEEFNKLNERRYDLIDKKYNDGGLTEAENIELEELQEKAGEYLDEIFDNLTIEGLKELLKKYDKNS